MDGPGDRLRAQSGDAMRDGINFDERDKLVAAVRGGVPWEEARTMLRGVDPEALDHGWRDTILRLAGVSVEAQVEPEDKPRKLKKG